MKVCSKCGEEKPLNAFSPTKKKLSKGVKNVAMLTQGSMRRTTLKE